jgi:phage/plasmid-like protein (TIGR03299 family)
MSSLIETMAYAGEAPWHGIGNKIEGERDLDIWRKKAGMDWEILEAPVRYVTDSASSLTYPGQKVLYRSDSKCPLSVVSDRYKVVQPDEILEFYRDLSEISGFEMETAGVLRGGRTIWALAKTGQSVALKGNDVTNGYVLLATACDGTLATTAQFTSIRVVCNNTLAVALETGRGAVKVKHSTKFNAQTVKRELGISVATWDEFMYRMKALSERKVKTTEAFNYFVEVFAVPSGAPAGYTNERAMKKAMSLYEGAGRGAELSSAKGTAFGLLNAVTEFVDHERRAKSADHRLDSAWFGLGAALKTKALEHVLNLIA